MKLKLHIILMLLVMALICAHQVPAQQPLNERLLEAVKYENTDAVKALLKAGANVNAKGKYLGERPLSLAVTNGDLNMTRLLLDAGAEINARQYKGQTALMCAYHNGTVDIIRLLASRGANVNAKDDEGGTALMSLAVFDKLDILQALIDAGADVNAANKDGITALMKAAYNRELPNVQVLLLAGAAVAAKDKDGWTASDYAEKNRDDKIIRALKVFMQLKTGKAEKDEAVFSLRSIKRCDDNPDAQYDRRKILEQFAQMLNAATGGRYGDKIRGYYINASDRPRYFSIQDLSDLSNQGSSLQCVNFIDKHVYHFSPYHIPVSYSHIAVLEGGNIKIYKSVNCLNSMDKIEDVVTYLNLLLKNDGGKDQTIDRVTNYRKYGKFIAVHDYGVDCN